MKKYIVITLAIICLIPAAGITSQLEVGPAAQSTPIGDRQSGIELLTAEEMVNDGYLVQISARSSHLRPWGDLVVERGMEVSKIKLWDEAERSSLMIDIYSAPGRTTYLTSSPPTPPSSAPR